MTRPRSVRLLLALSLGAAPTLSGCAVLAWLVGNFTPPKTVPAICKLPKDKKILVLVDSDPGLGDCGPIKRALTEKINQQFTDHDVARETVPYVEILRLMAELPEYNMLNALQVGDRLGADLVLRVVVDRFTLREDPASPLWQGRLRVTVQVGDVKKARRHWPQGRRQYPIQPVTLPSHFSSAPDYDTRVIEELAEKMSDRVGKLFYDYKIDPTKPKPEDS